MIKINYKLNINNIVNASSQKTHDYLSAMCIAQLFGAWVNGTISEYFDSNNNLKPFCTDPRVPVQSNFTSNIPHKFENFNNMDIFKIFENYDGFTITPISPAAGSAVVSVHSAPPSRYLDYIFQYTYPICFIGAILFSVNSFINVDVTSMFANKNISTAFNIYMGIYGYVAICYYYNFPILLLDNFFNSNTIKINYNS
jgi:hypothetical protein